MARTARQKGFGPYDVRLLSCHPGRMMPEQMFFFLTHKHAHAMYALWVTAFTTANGEEET